MDEIPAARLDSVRLNAVLDLLGDDDPQVTADISKILLSQGADLENLLHPLIPALDAERKSRLTGILSVHRRRIFEETWLDWLDARHSMSGLERALSHLARLDLGLEGEGLSLRLDELAAHFKETVPAPSAEKLMHFLFTFCALTGARDDYYNPLNSNLIFVLNQRRGIPISLALIAILTGSRCGINLYGCNFPGHFLAAHRCEDGKVQLFDCFNGGRQLSSREMEQVRSMLGEKEAHLLDRPALPLEILERHLANLRNAWNKKGDKVHSFFYRDLMHEVNHLMDC